MTDKSLPSHQAVRMLETLLLAFLLIVSGWLLGRNAFRHFNFFDMGAFIDASWRIFKGQMPYRDFMLLSGPFHLYMNVFFFKCFGFGKTGLLAHLVTVHTAVTALVFCAVRRHTPFWAAFAAATLTAASFYWPLSHPFWDPSAHFWGVAAVAFICFTYPFQSKRRAFWAGFVSGFFSVVSFITKTNIGLLYGPILFAVLLTDRDRSVLWKGFGLGLLSGIALTGFFIRAPKEYIEQCFTFYGGDMAGRRFPKLFDLKLWWGTYYGPAVLMVFPHALFHAKSMRTWLSLFLGITLVGALSAITGSMNPKINIPLWGIQAGLGYIVLYRSMVFCSHAGHRRIHQVSAGLLTIWAGVLTFVAFRYGADLTVWKYREGNPIGHYVIQSEPFKGWRTDEGTGVLVDQMTEYIRKNIPEKDSLLILTDMQILYSLTDRDSFRGIPFIFYIGSEGYTPVPGKLQEDTTHAILSHPPDWIVTNWAPSSFVNDLIPFLHLTEEIKSHYGLVQNWGRYALLKRM